jgi:hypothetical protein
VKLWNFALILVTFSAITHANADMAEAERPPPRCTPISCVDPSTGYYTQRATTLNPLAIRTAADNWVRRSAPMSCRSIGRRLEP